MGANRREEGIPSELKSIHSGPSESNVCESSLTVSSLSLGAFFYSKDGHIGLPFYLAQVPVKNSQNRSPRKPQHHPGGLSRRRERKLCFSAALMNEPGTTQAVGTLWVKSAPDRGGAAVGVLGGRYSAAHVSLSSPAKWRDTSTYAAHRGYLWAHVFIFFPGRFEEMEAASS